MGKKKQIEGQLNLFETVSEEKQSDRLFNACSDCWCFDCRHNDRNEAVPREMCGQMMACPACEGCIQAGKAEICIIGSGKKGCRVRAAEEANLNI